MTTTELVPRPLISNDHWLAAFSSVVAVGSDVVTLTDAENAARDDAAAASVVLSLLQLGDHADGEQGTEQDGEDAHAGQGNKAEPT